MATSNALRELEGLLDLEARGKAEAAQSARILEEDQREARRDPQQKARFATPEALATAVGASWILGPGGILLGIAQGILGKREQQNAIDAYEADNQALGGARDVIYDRIDELKAASDNPADIEQLENIRTTLDEGAEMSKSPYLFEESLKKNEAARAALEAYSIEQEKQSIANSVREAEAARLLSKEQNDWYVAAQGKFAARTQPYKDVMKQTDLALDALANGTPSDLWAAIRLVNKALDPTGAVKISEAETTSAIGGYKAELNNFLEKFRSGAQLGEPERRDLTALLYNIRETENKFALATENEFRAQMDTLEMPLKFYDDFKVVDNVPAAAPGPIAPRTLATDDITAELKDLATGFSDQDIRNNIAYLQSLLGEDTRTPEQKAADLQRYSRPGRD